MTCEHTHKDDPENAVCEDCYQKDTVSKDKPLSEKLKGRWRTAKKEYGFEDFDNHLVYLEEVEEDVKEAVEGFRLDWISLFNNMPVSAEGMILMSRTEIGDKLREFELKRFGEFK